MRRTGWAEGVGRGAAGLLAQGARHGRAALVIALAVGIAAPEVAGAIRPWVPPLAAATLFLSALRVAPTGAVWNRRALMRDGAAMLGLQLALPMALALAAAAAGWDDPLTLAVILMAAAPAIAGGPAIAALAGGDPAPALRLVTLGVAALPLTAPAVFWLAPGLGDAQAAGAAALRLLAVVVGALALAAVTRRLLPAVVDDGPLRPAADGLGVLVMAVMVVGLMAAVGPAVRAPETATVIAFAAALAANFGMQLAAWGALRGPHWRESRIAYAVCAGNRNMALFLIALPPAVTDPMLAFIGFYQIPMFLTPILLGGLSVRASRRSSGS
jgi:predicted Na+-dependent transporter